jgi:ABC-2 type transport system permease protein
MQQHPGEQEITAVLKAFLVPQPTIAFVSDNNERDIGKAGDKGYKMVTHQLDFRYALINQGFKVVTVSLQDQDIPKDISCLVIADPKAAYNEKEQAKIQAYITAGGNVLFAGEPGRQNILNPMIKPLGVQLMDGVLVQESKDNAPDFVLTNFAPTAGNYSKEWKNNGGALSMLGVAGLHFEKNGPFTIEPIVVTNKKNTWNKLIKVNLDSAKLTYNPELGDKKETIPVGLGLSRKIAGKEQRIMIFGDADFMSNAELGRGNPRNFSLVVQMFKWFSNGEFPVDTSRPETQDNKITISPDGIDILQIIFLGIIPGLILLGGAVLLIRRKRK